MKIAAAVFFLVTGIASSAQEYKVTTDQEDDFSKSLVQLLNCAATRFTECKGDSIRSTWLMGDDYKLNIPFPGSSMAVVRIRDWDKNAYVEFRGYNNAKELSKGILTIVEKIRKTLGHQLVTPVFSNIISQPMQSISFSLKDKNGYFTPNMELLPGSSSADPYLLGPEKEDSSAGAQKYFILLKVHGRIPSYQYYIADDVTTPDEKLHKTLRELLTAAATDFNSLKRDSNNIVRKKRTDTIQINGYTVLINRRGHHSAVISFPVATDSIAFKKQWHWCHQAVQAALGSVYVYHPYSLSGKDYISYYALKYDSSNPTVYLENSEEKESSIITIHIRSSFAHETKRSAGLDE